ncbi:uncharacterized protein ABDE67_001263 [Symphorus nematophorus]
MSSTVKVTYNPINETNTFTSGDIVSGQVTLEVAKDYEIESLSIKFKGKAEVLWSERHGQTTVVYHSKDKYFSIKHYFIRDKVHKGDDNQTLLRSQNGDTYSNVVAPGCHVYPFTFQIPFQDMPSSFKGSAGKIVYLLEARLSRSMRMDKKDSTKINFVTKKDMISDPALMAPQHESKDKKMKLFTSGTVAMDVSLEKTGFFQGEGMKVLACIQNNSSREIKPKYCVYRKHSFFAKGERRLSTKDILKEVGEPIPPSGNEYVVRVITIPQDAEPSILNCSIIKAEHRLRVYLDVKYALDPEIKFPIVILPASQVPAALAPPPAASGFGFEPFGNPNPPAWGTAPLQPAVAATPNLLDPPPPYGAYGMYPRLNDFGNKWQPLLARLLQTVDGCAWVSLVSASSELMALLDIFRFRRELKMTIKTFAVEYDAINSKNTFTSGDTVNGRIIVEVSKETKIQSLIFMAKGYAEVCWSEHYGQYVHIVYKSDEQYYDFKQHILREARQDGTEVIGKGRHVFPFSFKIPDRTMPASFKSCIGKVVHKLKAELKQSMRETKKAKTHFTFVSKADMDIPGLMEPQYGCQDKSVKVFGSGNVSVDVHTERMGYKQGNAVKVTAEIRNHSTRSVKPKFILYEKKSYFAQGRRKVNTKELHKEKSEAVASSSTETVTKVITIPKELPPSILNCSIIKLEYRLKIHLDVKCASDPEIKLPIVVLPASEVPAEKQLPASADFGFEAFGSPNQTSFSTTPQHQAAPQPEDPPPAYGAYAMYPSFPESGKYQSAL